MDSLIRFRVFASSQQQKEKTKIISKDYVVLIFVFLGELLHFGTQRDSQGFYAQLLTSTDENVRMQNPW